MIEEIKNAQTEIRRHIKKLNRRLDKLENKSKELLLEKRKEVRR